MKLDPRTDTLWRTNLLYVFVLLFGIAIIAKIIVVQTKDREELKDMAEKREYRVEVLEASRGNIFSSDNQVMATSVPYFDVFFDYKSVDSTLLANNIDSLCIQMSQLFPKRTPAQWKEFFGIGMAKNSRYYKIGLNVPQTDLRKMQKFVIFNRGLYKGGLITEKKIKREHPYKDLASLMLGMANESKGYYFGLEGAYNDYLKGQNGRQLVRRIHHGGWVPVDSVPRLRAKAVSRGWGILLREARPDEAPPTLIRPPKLFRPVAALFKGLGIAPGYTEADVSVPFMCYFSLFFAMLVGDGGYGAIILALTAWGWVKTRPGPDKRHRPVIVRSWLTMLTVFSSATVIWGLLSNTWFGAGLPFARDWATVKWLAGDDQNPYNHIMLLCFTIGASHLILARVWSGISTINDRVCLSQFGWAGIVFFMYWTTCSIVGIFQTFPSWLYWELGVSLVLVFGFTLKGSELKSRGIELGMLPLNIMSCLGDIISYVRLFAVGLASVKVAQNFNDMAIGLDLPLWIKWIPLVLILLVGHGLNFAMAGLSILVHAVRLNTLEFSNHKGISWAGYAFTPFKKH